MSVSKKWSLNLFLDIAQFQGLQIDDSPALQANPDQRTGALVLKEKDMSDQSGQ